MCRCDRRTKKFHVLFIQIGNAWIDDSTGELGIYDYVWTHSMNSDETNAGIHKYCDFSSGNFSSACDKYRSQVEEELGNVDIYNIYAPPCKTSEPTKSLSKSSVSLSVARA